MANSQERLKLVARCLLEFTIIVFLTPFAFIVDFLLGIIEPIIEIRFGKLYHDRIGTLGRDTDYYLRCKAKEKNNGTRFTFHFFVCGKPANRYLLTLIKRRLFVCENRFILELYHILDIKLPIKRLRILLKLPHDKVPNDYKVFNSIPPQLYFTENDEKRGSVILSDMGIRNGMPFVCFHSRDKVYLDVSHSFKTRQEWSYHDHRDANINNYLLAAEYLSSRDISAIRMGYLVEHALESSNSKIIDYASKYRSDFGDIYLIGKCKFFLGTNAGLFCVAQAFGVPVAVANWAYLKEALLCKHDLMIPKKYWSIKYKRFLTFREILESGMDSWGRAEDFLKVGIELIENTPEEILGLAKEMNERIDGLWITTDEDEELQQRYKNFFPPSHYAYGFPSRIGAEFLRQNKNLLN